MKEFNEISFFESYTPAHIQYLISQGKPLIKELVGKNKPEKNRETDETTKEYVDRIYNFLLKINKNGGDCLMVNYKHGEGKTDGRNFSTTLSIQGIPTNIRNFIVRSDWKDYDMVNCHPTLLLYLAEQSTTLDASDTVLLKHYVNNRQLVFDKNNLTKNDITMMMFKDKSRPKNEYLQKFAKELENIKFKLVANSNITTTNTKNPISSTISQMLNILESKILYSVFKAYPNRNIALCFDGFMSGDNIEIEHLNEITKEYGIVWKIKDRSSDITVPEDFVFDSYKIYKKGFEENNHKIVFPLHFMSKVDGIYRVYSQTNFIQNNMNCPKFNKLPFTTNWFCDPTIKTFDRADFYPYNKNPDKTSANIFNTFIPLSRLDTTPTEDYSDFIKNYFDLLLYNLAERDVDMKDYLKKYIAHMIQYPEILPETIVYIRGEQGIGKDTLIKIINRLINNPTYTITIDDPLQIFGKFNRDASQKLMICINELSPTDAADYENKIKSFSTKETINIEDKGINGTTQIRNVARLFVLSNNIHIAKLSHSSRREFIIEGYAPHTNPDKCNEFWDKLHHYIDDDDCMNALFHHLNNIDLDGFQPRKFKRGQFYSTLMEANIPPIISFLYKMNYNTLQTCEGGDCLITHNEFANDYNAYCSDNNSKHKKLSNRKIETALNEVKQVVIKTKRKCQDDPSKRTLYWKFNKDSLQEYIKNKFYKYEYDITEIEGEINEPAETDSCKIDESL